MTNDGFRTAGRADGLSNNDVFPFYLRDWKLHINVARVDGRLYAFEGLCSHKQCPLSAGSLDRTTVTCQCHGSKFDLNTGAVLHGPATDPLLIFEAPNSRAKSR